MTLCTLCSHFFIFKLFHDGGWYNIETNPLICSANQWTGFYMISASVMKGLRECVFFYLMFLKIYYWEKLTFSKLVRKVSFSERKFEEMLYLWRAKGIFGKTFILASLSSAVLRLYKTVFQISFKLFCSEDYRRKAFIGVP